MEVYPDKRRLTTLIEEVKTGRVCLPNFQRDFVWDREKVADLLCSVLRGYFVGTVLLIRCDPDGPPFAPEFLVGASPALRNPRPDLLVLDGQQRLTSLLYAATAPDALLADSEQRQFFYLDLELWLKDPSDDLIVFYHSLREQKRNESDKAEVQFEQRWLPFKTLFDSAALHSWLYEFEDWVRANEPQNEETFRKHWRLAWEKLANDFQTFEVPVVELPRVDDSDPESIGRVCAIFEKLNSTGMDLSIYDLLTARLYRHRIRLHDLWNATCNTHPRINAWTGGKANEENFGVMILRTLALLRGVDPKPSTVISLSEVNFAPDWVRAAGAMERALQLVEETGKDGFGVSKRDWLPGLSLLPVLAALRSEIEQRRLVGGERDQLRSWYWSSVFTERYSSAVASKSKQDYSELLSAWTGGKGEVQALTEAKYIASSEFTIRSAASLGSSKYRGVFCLLALTGARDWTKGEALHLDLLEDHHIFPRAYLSKHGINGQAKVNSIANRTLISKDTNRHIQAKAPADYLKDTSVFPKGPSSAILAPHFIDSDAYEQMRRATDAASDSTVEQVFEGFVAARERAIIQKIREVCGAAGP